MGNKPSTIADHPLHDAKKNRWYEYLRKIESGVGSVNDAAPADGWTALHYAAKGGFVDVMHKLVEKGAQVEARCTKRGRSPLMLAVRQQHMDAAVALLHYSADVNGSDHWGDTPLHMAVERGSMALVTMLHEEGADLDAINAKNGTLATEVAANSGCIKIVEGLTPTGRPDQPLLLCSAPSCAGPSKLALFNLPDGDRTPTIDTSRTGSSSGGAESNCNRSPSSFPSAGSPRSGEHIPRIPRGSSNPPFTTFVTASGRTAMTLPDAVSLKPLPGESCRSTPTGGSPTATLSPFATMINEDAFAQNRMAEQLTPIFQELNLMQLLTAAAAWCAQQGADDLNDVIEEEGCIEDLADVLNLPRIKRNKFVARLQAPDAASLRIRSI